jgi:hypothetical protein
VEQSVRISFAAKAGKPNEWISLPDEVLAFAEIS